MPDSSIKFIDAEKNLDLLLKQVEQDNSIVLIARPGHNDIALLPAAELSSILETLYLLRSPKNAQILFEAIEESKAREAADSE